MKTTPSTPWTKPAQRNVTGKPIARPNRSADVQAYIETAMGGHVASELWEGEKRFDVTVRLPASTREDVGAIRSVMLPSKEGFLLPLSAVADVTMGVGRAAITRENGRRYVGIRMNVRNRDLGSFVRGRLPGQQPAQQGLFRNGFTA